MRHPAVKGVQTVTLNDALKKYHHHHSNDSGGGETLAATV